MPIPAIIPTAASDAAKLTPAVAAAAVAIVVINAETANAQPKPFNIRTKNSILVCLLSFCG